MDAPELKGICVTSQNEEKYEDQREYTENEPWEEEINPLGLLDLVYVEDEEEANEASLNETQVTSSISTKTNILEGQKPTNDNFTDSDEGDELEPVAVVDVLPGREEDFLPEGMTQECMEACRDTCTTSWVSHADHADHQWNLRESQHIDNESILQRVLEVPRQTWPSPIQSLSSLSTHQLNWQLAQQINMSQNHFLEGRQGLSFKQQTSEEQQAMRNEARRQYYHHYRQKYPELARIRNREYARRYRQANAERVRERQREYIKKYRERKRLEKEQAYLLGQRNGESEFIAMSDKN